MKVKDSFTFTYDATPPTITSITPDFGTDLNALEDDTDATLTVATSGVEDDQEVTVTLNGITYTGSVTNDSAEVVIPSADLNNLTEGEVILTADVLDSAGNAATQDSFTFTYDATPPLLPQ